MQTPLTTAPAILTQGMSPRYRSSSPTARQVARTHPAREPAKRRKRRDATRAAEAAHSAIRLAINRTSAPVPGPGNAKTSAFIRPVAIDHSRPRPTQKGRPPRHAATPVSFSPTRPPSGTSSGNYKGVGCRQPPYQPLFLAMQPVSRVAQSPPPSLPSGANEVGRRPAASVRPRPAKGSIKHQGEERKTAMELNRRAFVQSATLGLAALTTAGAAAAACTASRPTTPSTASPPRTPA